jgi:hypothetical protein
MVTHVQTEQSGELSMPVRAVPATHGKHTEAPAVMLL